MAMCVSCSISEMATHPNLKFYSLVIPIDGFHLEVDSYGAYKGRCEGVICVAEQETGFANTAVANDQDLEHVVKVLVS